MVFPVVMYGCESWTVKKAEHWKIDAFELWFWRRILESPLDSKEIQPIHPEGGQFWVFIGRTDAEAETPILWPPHAKSWLIGKDLDAGRDWGQEEEGTTGWDGWMASLTRWTWVWVNSGSWWWTGRPGMLRFMGSQRVRHNWVTELNWTESVEVTNRFKGLDLIDRVHEELLWMEVHGTVQEAVIKTIPKIKKCKKAKGCLTRPYK